MDGWENHFSSEPVSLLHSVGVGDVISKVIYAAANPVKDGLFDRVDQWPGVNGLAGPPQRTPAARSPSRAVLPT